MLFEGTGNSEIIGRSDFLPGVSEMTDRNANGSQFTLPKPKEHGAWGMLYVPFVIGVGIAGSFNFETLCLLIAITLAFLSQKPYGQLLAPKDSTSSPDPRKLRLQISWLVLYAGSSAGLFAWLYLHYQLKALIVFGLLMVPIVLSFSYFIRCRQVRTVWGELAGIVGLTMAGPMAHYVATGKMRAVGFALWWLCILYFAGSIFYVKAVVQNYLRSRSKLAGGSAGMEKACRIYHMGVLAVLLCLVILGQLPAIISLGFIPVIIRGLWVSSRPRPRLNFAIIGWTEVGYSIFFALILIAGLREGVAFSGFLLP